MEMSRTFSIAHHFPLDFTIVNTQKMQELSVEVHVQYVRICVLKSCADNNVFLRSLYLWYCETSVGWW